MWTLDTAEKDTTTHQQQDTQLALEFKQLLLRTTLNYSPTLLGGSLAGPVPNKTIVNPIAIEGSNEQAQRMTPTRTRKPVLKDKGPSGTAE